MINKRSVEAMQQIEIMMVCTFGHQKFFDEFLIEEFCTINQAFSCSFSLFYKASQFMRLYLSFTVKHRFYCTWFLQGVNAKMTDFSCCLMAVVI